MEPEVGVGGIGEIRRRGIVRPHLQELDGRGFTAVVDEQVGVSLHREDDAGFAAVGVDVLAFEIRAQAIGDRDIEIEGEVLRHRLVLALEAQGFGRDAGDALVGDLRQRARLEHVAVEHDVVRRGRYREERIVVHQRQDREFAERGLGCGAQVFRSDDDAAVQRFILRDGRVCLAVAGQFGGAHAGALGNDDGAFGREGVGRRGIAGETAGADRTGTNTAGLQVRCAVAGVGDLRGIGAGNKALLRVAELHGKGADAGVEGVGAEKREARGPLVSKVALVDFERAGEIETRIVERLARDEVHGARNAAVDHVGGGVLVDLDAAEKFGRNVVEAERAAAVCGEDVAAVEFGANEGQAANDHARTFDREAVGVVALFEAADVDTGYALQGFGHRTVGKGADIVRRHHVHERVGVALDRLCVFERCADAFDDNDVFVVDRGVFLLCRRRVLRVGGPGHGEAQREAGHGAEGSALQVALPRGNGGGFHESLPREMPESAILSNDPRLA